MSDEFEHFRRHFHSFDRLGLSLDLSRIAPPPETAAAMAPALAAAFEEMAALEAGAIANGTEGRRVGHYWLRAPALAPSPDIAAGIETCLSDLRAFVARVQKGELRGPAGKPFTDILAVGVGGSALGAQFLARALGRTERASPALHFLDNTDPDGIFATLDGLAPHLDTVLCLVISKSGGTREIWNALALVEAAFAAQGLALGPQAVAVTERASRLESHAVAQGFLARFPLWDWVGGRTSVFSAAGLLPVALIGGDIDALLAGAAAMDEATRDPDPRSNPAALLAQVWFHAQRDLGRHIMVVLPYKDRLDLLARYLQQLVMESLGKGTDRQGRPVQEGLSVFGNKGSTDQHAYVQQLREGRDDFFAAFIEVLRDTDRPQPFVTPEATAGDYLQAFLIGTRAALTERGRPSLTLTLDDLSERRLGSLLALFERAVGLYASLIDVNAYDQPGVEAGKKAADAVLALTGRVLACLHSRPGQALTAAEIAASLGPGASAVTIFQVLRHLAANPEHGVAGERTGGAALTGTRWRLVS